MTQPDGLPFRSIDHVQLAMPAGEEQRARAFYAGVLGMTELIKPEPLRTRGGVWFASGAVQLHLGVDPEFVPARKAHVGLCCFEYGVLCARLTAAGHPVTEGERQGDGAPHGYTHDPFGNRIELIGAHQGVR